MTEQIVKIISEAAENVTENYFKLPTTYEPSGIVRERVFCYELYHQLRLVLGDKNKLTLNGEIDKRGHLGFEKKDRKNPDFVFHIPGQNEGNTVVLEVKGKLGIAGIVKDFKTLITFVSEYKYQAGIFLIYNFSLQQLQEKLGRKIDEFIKSGYADRLYIMALRNAHYVELSRLDKLSSYQINQSFHL